MTTQACFGVRSSVAPLLRVLVATPATVGDFAAAGWRLPDAQALLREHAAFADLLEGLGVEVVRSQAPTGLVDACFTYDSAFIVPSGAVILCSAKPARRGEADWIASELDRAGVPAVARLNEPACADGGDMFWLDETTLAVGRGYRTNAAGHDQLGAALAADGVRIERFDLPHHLGPAHVLHLMSVCSPVSEDLAVVHPPIAPVTLLEALGERGVRTIPVEPDEVDSQGGNILAVRPGVIVMAEGNPVTRRALEAHGVEVHTYQATQLNKGDGGPTCLTRPLLRAAQ